MVCHGKGGGLDVVRQCLLITQQRQAAVALARVSNVFRRIRQYSLTLGPQPELPILKETSG